MNLTLLNPDFSKELQTRLDKVRANMLISEIDALLVGTTSNLYYLSGGVYRGYVYVSIDRDPVYFLIPPSESERPMVQKIRKPEEIPARLQDLGYPLPKRIGLEMSAMYYTEIIRLQKVFSGIESRDGEPVLRRSRMTKTDFELHQMREDGMRQAAVYSQIKHCYSEDMTDLEFQIEIERVLRREGCLGFLRAAGNRMEINMGSLLAGPNADVPSPYDFSMGGAGVDPSIPVGACGKIMYPGMTVMVDMNGGFNGYQSDMTRVWTVGEVSELAHRAHRCSIDILRDLEAFARPGVEVSQLWRRAEKNAHDAGLYEYFMGHRHKVPFIGHGVGIELNELPVVMERNGDPLLKNMTIALEPKFVLPDTGAVGVENTYIVTDTGLENITVLSEDLHQL